MIVKEKLSEGCHERKKAQVSVSSKRRRTPNRNLVESDH